MSIAETDILDLVYLGKKANTLNMVITDHLPWDEDYEEFHLKLLQDKMNGYIGYVDNKHYLNKFPEKNPDAFIIEIYFQQQPTMWALDILTEMQHQIWEHRKAKSMNEAFLIIFYPPRNDAGPCKTGYVIEFYAEDDVNRLLDWDGLLSFDIRDYVAQEKKESNEQTLPN